MKRHSPIVFVIAVFVLGFSVTSGQDMVSLAEVGWANSDAMTNYDVKYKIELNTESKPSIGVNDGKSSVKPNGLQITFNARLVVSNTPKRLLFVREVATKKEGTSKIATSMECCFWENGKEHFVSSKFDGISGGDLSLFEFYRNHDILAVEHCFGGVLSTGIERDIESQRDSFRHRFANVEAVISPTGGIRVESKIAKNYRSVVTYDPESLMSTTHLAEEFDPATNEALRKIWWNSTQYELEKNVYRIKSCVFSKEGHDELTFGTASFDWHQFNVDSLVFPDFAMKMLSLNAAKVFLEE